jgi:hypothetical protein
MSPPQLPVQPDCRANPPYGCATGGLVSPLDGSDFKCECRDRKM